MSTLSDTYLTDDYLWIVVLGALASFSASFGIGANDVANSLATSVGAKSLTIKQAVVVATVFEFLGALFFGGHVTKTIRKGIADQECFEDNPALLMHGMMCVLFAVAIWLFLATWLGMPVSTTHSCVGAIVGMTTFLHGTDCVFWTKEKDDFPFIGGVLGIVISWFTAPLFSCIIGGLLFLAVRRFVLRSENSYERGYKLYPVIIWGTLTVCIMFVIFKAGKGKGFGDDLGDSEGEQNLMALGLSAALALIIALISIPTCLPWIRKRIDAEFDREQTAKVEEGAASGTEMTKPSKHGPSGEAMVPAKSESGGIKKFLSKSLETDPHRSVQEGTRVGEIHANAEVFDEKTEMFFRYVQVFTCCCDSFAHGANDVANSIGPFAAIYMVYKSGEVSKKQELGSDAYWILGMGGVGICVGLALYGYKIMEVLGTKMAKVTPSRGFAIELGAVIVIIFGTRMGIPLSTTHCQVGATCGVALTEGKEGINYKELFTVMAGWVLTLVVAGLTAGIFASIGAFAPTAYGQAFDGMVVSVPTA